MLLTNGRIYTLDASDAVVDTLVVRDGRVAFAGRRTDVNVSDAEETIDLGGRAVVPGLVDAHGHLMHLARARLSLDAGDAGSETEVAERLGAPRAVVRPGRRRARGHRGVVPERELAALDEPAIRIERVELGAHLMDAREPRGKALGDRLSHGLIEALV